MTALDVSGFNNMNSRALILLVSYYSCMMISKVVSSHQYVVDFFVELNKAARNASIFESVEIKHAAHRSMVAALTFKFADDLVEFLQRFNSTHIDFRLLNSTSTSLRRRLPPLFYTRVPLFLVMDTPSLSRMECGTSQLGNIDSDGDGNVYTTQWCHEKDNSYPLELSGRYILRSLEIRFDRAGLYSLCTSLVIEWPPLECVYMDAAHDVIVDALTGNGGGNGGSGVGSGSHHRHQHQFRYKPFFIVIMYMLCAVVLAAICVAKYFLHRHKLVMQKRHNQSVGIKSRSSLDLASTSSTTRAVPSDADVQLKPLLHRVHSAGEVDQQHSKNRVLFQVNSQDNLKQIKSSAAPRLSATPIEEDEVEHILKDKPWSRSVEGEPLLQLNRTLNQNNEQLTAVQTNETKLVIEVTQPQPQQLQPQQRPKMLRSTSNLSKNSAAAIVYESNV